MAEVKPRADERAFEEVRAWLDHLDVQIPEPAPVAMRFTANGVEDIPVEEATDNDLVFTPDAADRDDLTHAVLSIVRDCYETFPGRHNWRRWSLTGRVSSFLYCSGLTSNGGSYEMNGRDPIGGWIRHLPTWTMYRRCYVLWKPMWWWECQWRQGFALHRHRPVEPYALGSCARCLPCPSCGSPYVGLFTEVDDKGRILDSPKRIAGAIFPHDENVSAAKVKTMVDELCKVDAVRRYSIGNANLLWLPKFLKHQRIAHPTASKLPPHPDDLTENDSAPPPEIPPTGSGGSHENLASGSRLEVEVGSGTGEVEREVEPSSSCEHSLGADRQADDDDGTPPRWAFLEAERQAKLPRRPTVAPIGDHESWVLKAARRAWSQHDAEVSTWTDLATDAGVAGRIASRAEPADLELRESLAERDVRLGLVKAAGE